LSLFEAQKNMASENALELNLRGLGSGSLEAKAIGAMPSGTVTFLLVEIEPEDMPIPNGSERLEIIQTLLKNHRTTTFQNIATQVSSSTVCAVFDTTARPLSVVQEIAKAEQGQVSPARLALYTGNVEIKGGYYFGSTLNRTARLLTAAHPGQILLGASSAELLKDQLPGGATLRNLGQHRLRSLVRPEQIYQLILADISANFPPLRTLDNRQSNLPAEMTAFIGREAQIVEAHRRLQQPDCRILTITGPSGIGKSRLAMQVASRAIGEFEHGVYWVTLGGLSDNALLVNTICQALGVRETSGIALPDALKSFLTERHLLLFLDNFDAASLTASTLSELLNAAPNLKMLVTCQKKLGRPGESEYRLTPMRLPSPEDRHTFVPEQLEQVESVRLFMERARATNPDFELSRSNVGQIIDLLHRLEGVPLAIELAASRTDILSGRVETATLIGSNSESPADDSGVRGTLDWSYNLLEADEKRLFIRLGVFVNGCTGEAAEKVCNAAGDLWLGVPDRLEMLVRKSFLRYKDVAVTNGLLRRYEMLETVRLYALERIALRQEANAIQEAHARYYLKWLETTSETMPRQKPQNWLELVDLEYDNLRAALDWAHRAPERAEIALRLAAALGRYWYLRGRYAEGRERLALILKAVEHTDLHQTYSYARALNTAGLLARLQGDLQQARARGEESVAIFRLLGEVDGLGVALNNMGQASLRMGDYAQARTYFTESLEIFRARDNQAGTAEALEGLASANMRLNDYEQAWKLAEEALSTAREINDVVAIANALTTLGQNLVRRSEPANAAIYIDEAIGTWRKSGDKFGLTTALNLRGMVSARLLDFKTARSYFEEFLALRRELGDRQGIANAIINLGVINFNMGDLAQAQIYFEKALTEWTEKDSKTTRASILGNYALVLCEIGDYERSRVSLTEALELYVQQNDRANTIEGLAGFAGIAALGEQDLERAARLIAAAKNMLNKWNLTPEHGTQRLSNKIEAILGKQLPKSIFESLQVQGQKLTMEEAVAYALGKF
jgi:predicted ATPase/Tfp pilus assembly protein PilF